MKTIKSVVLIMTIVILASCAGTYRQATYVSSKAYIGMPISEFKAIAGSKASIEAMESGYTVYRISDYDPWTGARIDTRFYYFNSHGRLIKIDGGEFKYRRYQLEIINN